MESKLMANSVELAENWILNSGIQNLEGEQKGGFNSWYDLEHKKYEFLYSEITGYGITMLLYLNRLNPDKMLVERAKLAANWLLSRALHESGGIKTRHYYDTDRANHDYSFESGILYAFDNGIVAYGLVNLYNVTKEGKYLKAAENISKFLIERMQKESGEFYASYDAKSSKLMDDDSKWSTQSGSYHAKIALPMIEMFKITKDDAYRKSAINVCNAALRMQQDDGRFITYRTEKDTHIHPHCYSAEGLLYAGLRLQREDFIQGAAKAAEWVLNNTEEGGSIKCLYSFSKKMFVTYERCDVLAQTLRLASFLQKMGKIKDNGRISRIMERVINFQKSDGVQKGGFYYGMDTNKPLPYLNSWCTMFALQALHMNNSSSSETEFFV